MRGLDNYYGDDGDAFAGVEELNDRIAELEAENEALRGRIEGTKAVIRVCSFTTSAVVEDGGVFGGLEVVPVANVLAALDGDA